MADRFPYLFKLPKDDAVRNPLTAATRTTRSAFAGVGAVTALALLTACDTAGSASAPATAPVVEPAVSVPDVANHNIDHAAFAASCEADLYWGVDALMETVPGDMIITRDNGAWAGFDTLIDREFWGAPTFSPDLSALRDRFGGFLDGRAWAAESFFEGMFDHPEGEFVLTAHPDQIPLYCAAVARQAEADWPPSGDHPLPMPLAIPAAVKPAEHPTVDLDQNAGACFQDLTWGVSLPVGGGRVWWVEPQFGTTDGRYEAVKYFDARRAGADTDYLTGSLLFTDIANYCVTVTADLGHWPPAPGETIPLPTN